MANNQQAKRFVLNTVRTYEKNGEEKRSYHEIGVAFLRATERGEVLSIQLHALPINGEIVGFEPPERSEKPDNRNSNQTQNRGQRGGRNGR